ncbi:hypothetical protein Dimus_011331 [Dionaea muscipula]
MGSRISSLRSVSNSNVVGHESNCKNCGRRRKTYTWTDDNLEGNSCNVQDEIVITSLAMSNGCSRNNPIGRRHHSFNTSASPISMGVLDLYNGSVFCLWFCFLEQLLD